MSLFDSLRQRAVTLSNLSVIAALYPAQYAAISLEAGPSAATRRQLLDALLAYVLCNDLYRQLGLTVTGEVGASSYENIRSLRNPAKQFTTFYTDMLWTNPQRVEAENERIIPPLDSLRRWSNWSHGATPTHRAALAAFQFALYGELFIKTNQKEDGRPYHITIDPRHIDEGSLDVDERGYIEYIRMDIPTTRRDRATGKQTELMRTEVWDTNPTRVRVWEYDTRYRERDDLSKLPTDKLIEERIFGGGGRAGGLAVDWIPVAYAAFEVMDDGRGWSPLVPALEAIDEANRVTTGSHRALAAAERVTRMLVSDNVDSDGRPKPPPPVTEGGTVAVDGVTLFSLPSGWRLADIMARFDFAGIRAITQDQVDWLYRELPELQFNDAVRDMGDPSGRAIHYRLAPILKRPGRARAIAEACQILANQHALTLGSLAGIWRDIGTYEAGDFAHQFAEQSFLAMSRSEKLADVKVLADAGAGIGAAARVAGLSVFQADDLAGTAIPPER